MALLVAGLLAGGVRIGPALLTAGVVGTLAVLAWNVVWLNTVLFRITREEIAQS
jgi:hypothetical protein